MWLSKYYITREFHNEASSDGVSTSFAFDLYVTLLSAIFGLSELKYRGNNFNQNRGNNFNQGQIYRPPVNQPVAHQGPAPQTHGVSKTDFERYVTANDAVLRNMQNQGQNLQSQMANLTDMLSKFVTANTASTSGYGTLPGNTVTNQSGAFD
ncbi:hypothetical protein Tco_1006090 [Tanacetum coccineum]|uniref:Uncharacterized protein n=1 Tax=Tanacetum coccineum TaxID=301880 RepID=A0ABQ5FJ32_9ASTR